MSDDKNKVLSIVPAKPAKEEENVINIIYADNSIEVLDADAFAMTEEVPGFLAFWKETPYELICFLNSNMIKKITITKKED